MMAVPSLLFLTVSMCNPIPDNLDQMVEMLSVYIPPKAVQENSHLSRRSSSLPS